MRVLVVGLGAQGATLALELVRGGHEVGVVDRDRLLVDRLARRFDLARCLDVRDGAALGALEPETFDEVVLALPGDFDATQLAVHQLVERHGHRRVTAFATTEGRRRILERIGAKRVVTPGLGEARNLAVAIGDARLGRFEFFGREQGFAAVELAAAVSLDGKSDPRVRVVAARRKDAPRDAGFVFPEDGELSFEAGDELLVFGRPADLLRFLGPATA